MAVIVHLTSAHGRFDTRIFLKECRSLSQRGHEVTILLADGAEPQVRDGVRFESVRPTKARLSRMLLTPMRLFRRVMALRPDVCHLHDPELIPIGLLLKARGVKVIFDAHEDLPKQILTKPYLPGFLRPGLACAAGYFLRWTLVWMDGLVAATPSIHSALKPINNAIVTVNNFPILGELSPAGDRQVDGRSVCYIGGISEIRGIIPLVQAMELLPAEVRLKLAGPFEDPALEKSVRGLPGWSRVDYLGTIGRAAVADVMAHSVCGLVTFLPAQNHIEAQPNKLFEYMSAGLPVIASDFPLWRALLGEGDCGLCVDPQDPKAIAGAVRVLLGQPGSALAMGLNGERAVRERYNWEVEAGHLGSFYDSIVGPRGKPTETAMPV